MLQAAGGYVEYRRGFCRPRREVVFVSSSLGRELLEFLVGAVRITEVVPTTKVRMGANRRRKVR
jgi:hypothetical protein